MSDQISDGGKVISCREVVLGRMTLIKAAEHYARSEYPDCDMCISNVDDGHGGRILLFTKKSLQKNSSEQGFVRPDPLLTPMIF